METSLLEKYGENLSEREYVTDPAIGRDEEIKQVIMTILTPDKSAILVGLPGIGKTAIVEGVSYRIKKGVVPNALKDYKIYKLNTSALLGNMPGTDEPKIVQLLQEIKFDQKIILFIDEIHTLMGTGASETLDFANIFKPGLDRGNIKIIGATTTKEFNDYIMRDKAFMRRFQRINVAEPTRDQTIQIIMQSLPRIEHKTNAHIKYDKYTQEKLVSFVVDLCSEFNRTIEYDTRYPDIVFNIVQHAFSNAIVNDRNEVNVRDFKKAIDETKLVFADKIKKETLHFNEVFIDLFREDTPQRLKG